MNRARVAILLRELAEEFESVDAQAAHPRQSQIKKPRRKPIRQSYVPQRHLSEIEIARARQRARKLGIPTA